MPLSVRLNWTSRAAALARPPGPVTDWCPAGICGALSRLR